MKNRCETKSYSEGIETLLYALAIKSDVNAKILEQVS